MNFTTSCQTTS